MTNRISTLKAQISQLKSKIPVDAAAEATLAHAASLTYGWLLAQCAAKYPGIVVPNPGADLTAAQRSKNWLRGADGKLKIGDLSVGAATRVLDPTSPANPTCAHLISARPGADFCSPDSTLSVPNGT